MLREIFPHTGKALVLGLTGPPGAGKSTLANSLVRALRAEGRKVAVLAVDPSSPFSGGAILGDRVRMTEHHDDASVFIRSMATRGRLGGLAAATADMALLLDAGGFDTILVETVGVGQDEIDIATLADVTALILVPGLGDDVQAMKAGIMEIADVYILNKADHAGIEQLERELESLLALAPGIDGWKPPVVRTVASEDAGIAEALAAVRSCHAAGVPEHRAVANWSARLRALYRERLENRLEPEQLGAAAAEVAARRQDPYTIVERWLNGRE